MIVGSGRIASLACERFNAVARAAYARWALGDRHVRDGVAGPGAELPAYQHDDRPVHGDAVWQVSTRIAPLDANRIIGLENGLTIPSAARLLESILGGKALTAGRPAVVRLTSRIWPRD